MIISCIQTASETKIRWIWFYRNICFSLTNIIWKILIEFMKPIFKFCSSDMGHSKSKHIISMMHFHLNQVIKLLDDIDSLYISYWEVKFWVRFPVEYFLLLSGSNCGLKCSFILSSSFLFQLRWHLYYFIKSWNFAS